jgi:Arc/MetJ-type ribon-helix-helix transcriptional regulator
MEVQLTDDQQYFVRQAIERGRYNREEDAIADALALWEERERRRAEILVAVDFAEASYGRGEGDVVTNDAEAARLFEEIQAEGMQRFAAKVNNR